MAKNEQYTVQQIDTRTRIDRESGSLDVYRIFFVTKSGGTPHTVNVRVSHSGTPQSERCDCQGYRYRRTCKHITAVYDAGVLVADPEW